MEIPDLIGMDLNASISRLVHLTDKYNIIIKSSLSPFTKDITKHTECRVIRQITCENNIELTISYF